MRSKPATHAKVSLTGQPTGFTLIEMVGVLAIIAIMAGLLVPRIFNAINESRLNSAAMAVSAVKSAAASYYAKYGKFGGYDGADLSSGTNKWDLVLLQEGLLEKPFETRLSTSSSTNAHQIQLVPGLGAGATPTASNAAYDLDRSSTPPNPLNDAFGKWVVQAFIQAISLPDAIELNNRVDGQVDQLTPDATGPNTVGRVKFTAPGSDNTVDVYIYIAHK